MTCTAQTVDIVLQHFIKISPMGLMAIKTLDPPERMLRILAQWVPPPLDTDIGMTFLTGLVIPVPKHTLITPAVRTVAAAAFDLPFP